MFGYKYFDVSRLYTCLMQFFFFFFNDTATTEIYTLSLHDALPICRICGSCPTTLSSPERLSSSFLSWVFSSITCRWAITRRSEEHTSELQSRQYLVCRLLLEKKKPHQYPPLRLPAHSRLIRADTTT